MPRRGVRAARGAGALPPGAGRSWGTRRRHHDGRGTGNTMSWNRWMARALIGLLALPVFGGCKQQLFLEPGDYADAVKSNLPKGLATDPHGIIVPPLVDPKVKPADVIDPVRPARFITLKECIAIGLEQGNDGGGATPFQNGGVPVFKSENLPSFNPGQSFAANASVTDA